MPRAPATGPDAPPRFDRFGTAHHLRIATADDLRRVLDLDDALWVATSAPIATIQADPTFLAHLDGNGDGRIRCDEVRTAIRWLLGRLRDTSKVRPGELALDLATVDGDDAEGARILKAARKILRAAGEPEALAVDLAAVRRVRGEQETRPVSGAGVVLPSAADDDDTRRLLELVAASVGGAPHPGGGEGVDTARLERFLADADAVLAWHRRGGEADLLPWGEATARVHALVHELSLKVEHFFALCEAVRLDPTIAATAWPRRAGELDLATTDAVEGVLAAAPLAAPSADGAIDPEGAINPRYRDAVAELVRLVPEAAVGLDRPTWATIRRRLVPFERWLAARPETPVAAIARDELARLTGDEDLRRRVAGLLATSRERAIDTENVKRVEKLILYQAYLLPFVNSFVSFPDLYDPASRALFEMGTLVIDGRRLTMSVRVTDRGRHARMSDESNMFVLYTKIYAHAGEELYEVAVPVTAGGRGTLQNEKRGIFHDVEGREHDALVVQIVENPISLAEAMAAPFRRLGRAISGRIEKMSASARERLETTGAGLVDEVHGAATASTAPASAASAPPPADATARGGLIAGGGIAVAALGSSLAFVTKTLAGLAPLTVVAGVATALLAVILPATLVAWLKLRRRDLSTILEGSDWAVNARMRLTRPLARTFTFEPDFPPGSVGVRRRRRWGLWIWLLVVLALAALVVLARSAAA